MKVFGISLLLFTLILGSCTSEYEERLNQAKVLKQRFLEVEESNFLSPNQGLILEMESIQSEIKFLAKVSGNEQVFMEEIGKY